MFNFYLNKDQQPNGDYEVHQYGCTHGAKPDNQIYLGQFINCAGAVAEAKKRFLSNANNINGCYYCARACNTG